MSQTDFDTTIKSLLKESVPLIDQKGLKAKLDRQENFVLLDTRTSDEYTTSHIEGAVFADYDDFPAAQFEKMDKNKPIVVYCTVGYRSEKIGEKLQDMGFKEVYNLYGGIFDWKNHNNPVVNAAGDVTDSVHTYNKKWSEWLINGIKVY